MKERKNERAEPNRNHRRQGIYGESAKEIRRDARRNIEEGRGGRMKRRVIVHIHDDSLRIGEALRLICDGVGYDNTCFERDCAWRLSDGHCVYVDLLFILNRINNSIL